MVSARKQKEYSSKYRAKNRVKCNERSKKWREKNKQRISQNGKRYYKQNQKYERNRSRKYSYTFEGKIIRLKARAKRDGLEFDLTVDDLRNSWVDTCPVFGTKLKVGPHGKAYANNASVDRIDNSKGYIPGNIQWISRLANSMKRDATSKQLIQFAKWVLKTIKE